MSVRQTDLAALAVRRASPRGDLRPPRRILSRVVLPLSLLLGFAGLAVWAAWDYLQPATPVTVTPVIARQGIVQATGVELFTTTGFIEPRPTPTEVTALAEGVVEALLVRPGQAVRKGDVVARLVDRDARLALRTAEEDLAERTVKVDAANADVEETRAQLKAAQSLYRVEEELYQKKAGGKLRFEQAEAQMQAAQAKLKQAQVRVQEAEARVRQGQLAVEAGQLRLERMQIVAPTSGVVMQVNAVPGRMVGARSLTNPQMDSLITLYDPASLQVRANVALDKFPLVQPGQPAVVEADAAPGARLLGIVLYDAHEAQLNNNYVLVKVALIQPPAGTFAWPWPLVDAGHLAGQGLLHAANLAALELNGPLKNLRPGMLVSKVRFISPARESEVQGGEVLRLWIPKKLLVKEGGKTQVWIVQQKEGRAALMDVVLGSGHQGDLVEVAEGLQPSDKLIVSGRETLKAGERVRIAGEE